MEISLLVVPSSTKMFPTLLFVHISNLINRKLLTMQDCLNFSGIHYWATLLTRLAFLELMMMGMSNNAFYLSVSCMNAILSLIVPIWARIFAGYTGWVCFKRERNIFQKMVPEVIQAQGHGLKMPKFHVFSILCKWYMIYFR